MRLIPSRIAIMLGMLVFSGTPLSAREDIGVRVVKYSELADAVRQLRGKVVVIDFWAHW